MANKNKANALVSNLGIGNQAQQNKRQKKLQNLAHLLKLVVRKAMHVQRLYSTKI